MKEFHTVFNFRKTDKTFSFILSNNKLLRCDMVHGATRRKNFEKIYLHKVTQKSSTFENIIIKFNIARFQFFFSKSKFKISTFFFAKQGTPLT